MTDHTRRALALTPLAAIASGGLARAAWAQTAPVAPQAPRPIAAAELFGEPLFSGAKLSPDGRFVAYRLRVRGGLPSLLVTELATMKSTPLASFDDVGIGELHWVNPERLVFNLATWRVPGDKRYFGPGLFAVHVDGSRFVPLVETRGAFLKAADQKALLPQWTRLYAVSARQDSPEVWATVVEAYDKRVGADFIRLLRVNTLTGSHQEIELPLHAYHWVMDSQDIVRALLTRHEGRAQMLWRPAADKPWQTLASYDELSRHLLPRRVDDDGTLWVQTSDRDDKRGVYAWDFAAGQVSSRALAASLDYDLQPDFVVQRGRLLGLRVTTDSDVTQWLDPAMQTLQDAMDKALTSTVNQLSVPTQGDGPHVLVHASADTQPGSTFIFHRESRQLKRLGDELPALRGLPMGRMDLVRIPARDGLSIPAWLTLPPGSDGKNLPLVVMVHGGPWTRGGRWQWDPEVQFLATRGYAVLQPEFRGSTGFGTRHFQAGWRQWGQAMQDDLTDAARWAIAQGTADPSRVAIMGASYGGYAALMGLVTAPDLFRCAVQWVGVTDPMLMYTLRWSDITDAAKTYGLPRLMGDPERDAEMLARVSPLKQAGRIRAPVLMAYGGRDQRVPVEHGERLRDALSPHNPQVEWVVYPYEGHGWVALETQIDFWGRVERFLQQHLAKK